MKINYLDDLIYKVKEKDISIDLNVLKKAYQFAEIAHYGQKRKTGEDYISHVVEVAKLLCEWKLDQDTIVAGILHDVVEDGGIKIEEISREFGRDVAFLVDGMTKVSNVRLKGSREQEFVENLRKMFLVMAKDLRVVLIKLADRVHNMRTLEPLPESKRIRIATETLEVFAPLAERLGMGEIKAELEDCAFPYVYPKQYKEVFQKSKPFYHNAEKHIESMRREVLKELARAGIEDVDIHARKKHLYSLWKKLERREIDWNFDKVYDIVAMRVIVDKVADCYLALGTIHSIYKPVPHIGVSDFIAQPKPNGYRSIHTKVFGPGGRIVEVQIRTKEMNYQAEYGLAAHWAYSEAKSKGARDEVLQKFGASISTDKLVWVKQLARWQEELKDNREFLNFVKLDFFKHRNFVFSPKGDVYDLPSGATPVDFAYAVHTGLGKYIKGARVNGRIVALDYELKSGDVCEIIKAKNPGKPNKRWLDFVVTNTAIRAIKKEY